MLRKTALLHGGSFRIVRAYTDTYPKTDKIHDDKVAQQRSGDAYYVEQDGNNQFTFEAEHNDDGKEQRHQGDRT